SMPPIVHRLARFFWPGALTVVIGEDAFRMPNHPLALELLQLTGPLPTPSANMSGAGSTGDPAEVWKQLAGRIDALLGGGMCPGGIESTVVDLKGEVLREGAISAADIARVVGNA